MLRYFIGVTLISLVLIILRKVMGNKISKLLRYSLWLIIPIYMVIAPFYSIDVVIPSQVSTVNERNNELNIITDENMVPVPLEQYPNSEKDVSTNLSVKSSTHIDWSKTIKYTYFSIAALFLVFISVYNMGFIFYCRNKRKYIETDTCGLKVFSIEHSSAPFLLGNKIYLSNLVTQDMRNHAIIHEYCHYKHGDMFWNIIRYLALAVNWFNPIVWYAFMLSEQDCELACDEAVLRIIGNDQYVEYGKVLLDLLANKSLGKHDFYLSTAMNGRSKRFMKERIVSIKNRSNYGVVSVILSLVIAVSVAGCSLIKTKTDEEREAHNEELAKVLEDIDEANSTSETKDIEEHNKAVEAALAAIDEANGTGAEGFDALEISELSDGLYTVIMTNYGGYYDGVQTCIVYPWSQFEFDQDYIDNLQVGDAIDITNGNYGYLSDDGGMKIFYTEIEVQKLQYTTIEPMCLYGTEYDGNVLLVNDFHSAYLLKVANSDKWKLFHENDTPICTAGGNPLRLKVSSDINIYDGFAIFADQYEDINLSYEEKKAIATFQDTDTVDIQLDSINEFVGFDYDDWYDYTVVNVQNNEVTDIYFWYHP